MQRIVKSVKRKSVASSEMPRDLPSGAEDNQYNYFYKYCGCHEKRFKDAEEKGGHLCFAIK